MQRLLVLCVAVCLGCDDGRTGGRSDNIPLRGVSYSERHTAPIVVRAAISRHLLLDATEASVVHALDLNTSDISLEKIIASEVADSAVGFVPRAEISQQSGQYVDTKKGTPARLWSITCTGNNKYWLRFRVDCNSGTSTDSYDVTLRATEESKVWSVDSVKQL